MLKGAPHSGVIDCSRMFASVRQQYSASVPPWVWGSCVMSKNKNNTYSLYLYYWSQYLAERTFGKWEAEHSATISWLGEELLWITEHSSRKGTFKSSECKKLFSDHSARCPVSLCMRISNDLEAILGQPTMQMNGSLKHSLYAEVKMCFPEISPICLNFAFRGWKKDVYTYSRNTRRQEIASHSFFQRPALYNWTVITNNHHQVPTSIFKSQERVVVPHQLWKNPRHVIWFRILNLYYICAFI